MYLHGHDGAICGVAVCTGHGWETSELAYSGNGLLVCGVTGGIGGDNSRLVGSTVGHMSLPLWCIWPHSWPEPDRL